MKRGHNIDDDFAKAMQSIGGCRPSDINPSCVTQGNADIVLVRDDAIIEVKTLMEDTRDKKDFHETYAKMHAKWVAQRKVPRQRGPKIKLNMQALPRECAHELIRHLGKRAAANVQKANQQIESLKETLAMPDAKGILVLCNSGNAFLPPHVLLYGLHHTLQAERFSSIHWVIYMTHNLPVSLPGLPTPADIFMPVARDGGTPMPGDLFGRIRDAWMSFVSSGTIVVEYEAKPTALFDARHLGVAAPTPKR